MNDEGRSKSFQSILARHEQIERELNLRLRQQAALAELGQRALSRTDLETLFDEAVRLVARTLEVEYCEVLELLPDGMELLLRAGLGWREGYIDHTKIGAGRESQAGYTLLSTRPVIVTDLNEETRFSPTQFLLDHGIRSGMTAVIPGKDRPFGILGTHSTYPRSFYEDDAQFLQAVANLLASSIARIKLEATLLHDVTEQKRAEKAQRLLAEAGKLLAASLDYSTALSEVAGMMVSELADWCSIYMVEDDQSIHQVAVAQANPEIADQILNYLQPYLLDLQAQSGVSKVLRSGQAEFYPVLTRELLREIAPGETRLNPLLGMGLKSAMILPLIARDETLGAIAFIRAESGKRYSQADLTLAQELARRVAIAIYSARLYQRAQKINEELEARVTKRTSQLQQMIQTLREEIAERKKAEQALRQSETMLQSLFNSAPDATILVNEEGDIVRVNQQTEAMFGYSNKELVNMSVDTLLPALHQAQHTTHRGEYFENPRPRPMGAGLDLRGRRKDGSQFPVDVMLSPVETRDGVMVISAVRDVSEREKMQAELAEMQHQFLDGLESERVLLAQELHDGPIQDLYGVIYELKAINIGEEGDRGQGLTKSVASAAAGAQHVIQVLRAICGELRPPTLAPFGLEKAIQEHISHIQKTYPDLETHLDLMEDGQKLPEKVRFALFRVYQNAVNNVVRHAQAGNLYIRFRFDSETATLEIEDDGTGFKLPSRWVEFSRQGHLGLVGMVERVRTINGQFNIVSSPGKGTTIRVTIPR
jgi:PAS domain S-box-containing protein